MRKVLLIILFIFSVATLYGGWLDVNTQKRSELILSLSFVDADTGFAIGWAPDKSVLLRTFNGGKSWGVSSFEGKSLFSVNAISSSEIFISGFSQSCLCGILMRSTDAGSSWSQTEFDEINNPYTYNIYNFLKKDDTTYLACGFKGAILVSSNSGSSWISGDAKAGDETFRFLAYPTKDRVYAVSGTSYDMQSKIYLSRDWGDTWKLIADLSESNTYINGITFTDKLTGYIGGMSQGREAILKSTDGGLSWNFIYLGDETFSILSLHFFGQDIIYAVNDFGKIIKSNNGGQLWEYVAGGGDEQINASVLLLKKGLPVAFSGAHGKLSKFVSATDNVESGFSESSNLHPNPATEFISINIAEGNYTNLNAQIIDEFGRIIIEFKLLNGLNTIDISELTNGIYVLKCPKANSNYDFMKFIKY